MELIVSSETSAIRTQTPGNYPKRNNLHTHTHTYIYIYMSILRGDVDISSSFYVLQVSLSSGMSSGSMNGGVWTSLVG